MRHKGTGVYLNPNKQQYEAWAVNQATGQEVMLGAMDRGAADKFPEARKMWEREVWLSLLTKSPHCS